MTLFFLWSKCKHRVVWELQHLGASFEFIFATHNWVKKRERRLSMCFFIVKNRGFCFLSTLQRWEKNTVIDSEVESYFTEVIVCSLPCTGECSIRTQLNSKRWHQCSYALDLQMCTQHLEFSNEISLPCPFQDSPNDWMRLWIACKPSNNVL